MFGGDTDPDGKFAELEMTDAMNAHGFEKREFVPRFRQNLFAL